MKLLSITMDYLHLNQRQLTIEFNITRLFNLIFIFVGEYFRSPGGFNDCLFRNSQILSCY